MLLQAWEPWKLTIEDHQKSHTTILILDNGNSDQVYAQVLPVLLRDDVGEKYGAY